MTGRLLLTGRTWVGVTSYGYVLAEGSTRGEVRAQLEASQGPPPRRLEWEQVDAGVYSTTVRGTPGVVYVTNNPTWLLRHGPMWRAAIVCAAGRDLTETRQTLGLEA